MATDGRDRVLTTPEKKEALMLWRRRIVKMEGKVRPKPRILQPTIQDRVRHSTRGPPTVYYLTTGPVEAKDPPNPYRMKEPPVKVRSRGYNAPTYKWRETATLRERLRVPDGDEEQSMRKPKPKPLPEVKRISAKFIRKKYEEELKKRTINNILVGFIQDDIQRKNENSITAQVAMQQAQKEIDNAAKSMAEFLSGEQKNCANLTKKLNEVLKTKKKRMAQIESEKKKMSEIKLRIFRQSEFLEKMKKCREFVLQVAPEDWKSNYEIETQKRQDEVKDDVYKLNRALHNYKTNCAGEDVGLERVLEDFIKEFSTAGPPSLPYDDPRRVFGLFKDLELKSLRALHHNTVLKKAVERAKGLTQKYDEYSNSKKTDIDNMLQEIKKRIEREKQVVEEKRELFNIMKEGPFKKMVASEEVLKSHALIKDVYEEIIDNPREELDTLEMLQEIGELFIDLNRGLEKIPKEKKNKLLKQAKRSLEKGMFEAEKAERRRKQVENMVKNLRRAREKPWIRTGRPLLFRTPPPVIPSKKESQKVEETKSSRVLMEDLKMNFPLVYYMNHPGPGPYKPPSPPKDLMLDYKKYYPDIQIEDTEEEDILISESEEEKEGKKKLDPAEMKKKVKRKKIKKIIDSDESE